MACRESKIPRTIEQVTEASLVAKKEIGRCYRLLSRELDKKIPITDSTIFATKLAEQVGIHGKTVGIAIQILRDAKNKKLSAGKDPSGLAGAALYIACLQNNEKKTQKDIAEAADVTEVTIRNRFKVLIRELHLVIPSKMPNHLK